jgi:hypothetical protein
LPRAAHGTAACPIDPNYSAEKMAIVHDRSSRFKDVATIAEPPDIFNADLNVAAIGS